MDTTWIAAQLHRMRTAAGIRQTDLARAVGVTQPTVSAWEHGRVTDYPVLGVDRWARACGHYTRLSWVDRSVPPTDVWTGDLAAEERALVERLLRAWRRAGRDRATLEWLVEMIDEPTMPIGAPS